MRTASITTAYESLEQIRPQRVELLFGMRFRGTATVRAQPFAQPGVGVNAFDRGDDGFDVVDVDQQPVLAVGDDLRRLPDTRRHERDPGRHRLENRLRAAFLPRRNEADVRGVIRLRERAASGRHDMPVPHAETLELAPDVPA